MQKDDVIYRRAAIDALRMDISIIPFAKAREYVREAIETIYNRLEDLPSAQSERPKGEWIPHKSIFGGLGERVYTCNQCGYNIGFHAENFCPHCGTPMVR